MTVSFWTPRWVLSHVLVAVLVVVMVLLGLWQLRRLDQRQDANALIEARMAAAAAPFDDTVPAADPEAAEFRRVTLAGEFDPDGEVFVANRNIDGQPGSWVLTPLVREGGSTVVVNRGFLPRAVVLDSDLAEYRAPTGPVAVEGLVQNSADSGNAGQTGELETPELSVADLELMQEITGLELAPVYVQALTITPAPTSLPSTLPPPELSEGPHLAYAVQWFVFTTIAVIGYGLVLRRIGRGDGSRGDVAADWDL